MQKTGENIAAIKIGGRNTGRNIAATSIEEIFLSTKEYSELTGRSIRSARRDFQNGEWRGVCKLEIILIKGRGGKSGDSHRAFLSSLPQEYINKYCGQNGRQSPDLSEVKRGTVELNDALSLEPQTSQVLNIKPDLSSKQDDKNETVKPSESLVSLDDTIAATTDRNIAAIGQENIPSSLEPQTSQVTSQVLEPEKWLTATQISELSGNNQKYISGVLSEAYNKEKPWLQHQLKVFESIEGKGHGGKSYLAHIDSLPADIRLKWYKKTHPPTVIQPQIEVKQPKPNQEIRVWRQNIIKPLLKYASHSPERSQMVQQLIGVTVTKPNGKPLTLTQPTIYQWLKSYENSGGTGLYNKSRKDAGRKRTMITRTWDKTMQELLTPDQIHQITQKLDHHISQLWRSGGGRRKIEALASMWLQRETNEVLEMGNIDPEVCKIPRNRIKEEYNKRFVMVDIQENDAKKFHDKYTPTITRTTKGMLPNQVHVGDVHPMDVSLLREGSEKDVVYPRLIAWFDVVTHQIWIDIKVCEKKEDVTQADVAQSFCNKSQVMGICGTLYLDNGMEYQHQSMLQAIHNLNGILKEEEQLKVYEEAPDVIRAEPYEAQVKPIERIFGVLEQNYFRHLPGYTGGDRMKKKTQNMGKTPKTFKGTELHEQLAILLEEYHNTPQKSLGNKSPNQVLADHINNGWQQLWIDRESLLMAFGETKARMVRNGCVAWDGEKYYHDELIKHSGIKLEVTYFKYDPRYAFVYLPDSTIICAVVEIQYQYISEKAEGAVEKKRRKKQLLRYLSVLKKHCSRLDLIKLTKDWNEQQPELPEGAKKQIERSPEAEKMIAAMTKAKNLPLPEPKPGLIPQFGDVNK